MVPVDVRLVAVRLGRPAVLGCAGEVSGVLALVGTLVPFPGTGVAIASSTIPLHPANGAVRRGLLLTACGVLTVGRLGHGPDTR